jgi:hypothetical protein
MDDEYELTWATIGGCMTPRRFPPPWTVASREDWGGDGMLPRGTLEMWWRTLARI